MVRSCRPRVRQSGAAVATTQTQASSPFKAGVRRSHPYRPVAGPAVPLRGRAVRCPGDRGRMPDAGSRLPAPSSATTPASHPWAPSSSKMRCDRPDVPPRRPGSPGTLPAARPAHRGPWGRAPADPRRRGAREQPRELPRLPLRRSRRHPSRTAGPVPRQAGVFTPPLVGTAMRAMGHIPVDRAHGEIALRRAVAAARSGEVVGLFPEATISHAWTLRPTVPEPPRWPRGAASRSCRGRLGRPARAHGGWARRAAARHAGDRSRRRAAAPGARRRPPRGQRAAARGDRRAARAGDGRTTPVARAPRPTGGGCRRRAVARRRPPRRGRASTRRGCAGPTSPRRGGPGAAVSSSSPSPPARWRASGRPPPRPARCPRAAPRSRIPGRAPGRPVASGGRRATR